MIIGINGFGRIGKHIYRILIKNGINVALINDPFIDIKTLFHQAKYDSVYGTLEDIELKTKTILAHGIETALTMEMDPKDIKWSKYKVDYVIECSGAFKTIDQCSKHDASKVILTCPSEDIPMFILGINHEDIKKHRVISAASCTTNCLAPLVKLMNDNFGIEEAFVSTIHALTGSQNTVDGKGKNLRSSRGCMNIIPTTTGAAMAIEKIIPAVKGKINAMAYRVPVPTVSLVDFVVKTMKPTSLEKIRKLIEKQKNPIIKNILGITDEEVVSSDLIGDTRSSILDMKASSQISPTFFKLVSWYDNEYGYSCRIVDIIFYLGDESKKEMNKS